MSREPRIAICPLREGDITLDAQAAHYLVDVHRARVGERFLAFDPEACTQAEGAIASVERQRVVCTITKLRAAPRAGLVETTLLQCAGKGHRPDEVVRAATALGVARVVFVRSERSQTGLTEKPQRWRAVALDAARQSGRPDLPELSGIVPLEHALARFAGEARHKWCCAPDARQTLIEAAAAWDGRARTVLVVGPEGGLGPNDECLLQQHGVQSVRLGRFVLRTELAAGAALSVLACAAERGGGSN